ncbi:hybrid sensor histidine kinase/response regulator [Streptomyces sp. LP11]|uniref:histidine kinase n=1 Tax=Streptomyces pyxinicus TaxID=2970331 RepID=A0ABT2B7A9_9ACTN|nr:hybrid sensor histidine kinase/response regulator [Streptomyces sp. LP11]MCS0604399.1 hybrid sensor histidine kinase/response regulator [Streptomyces sp. LP11]
MTAPGEGHELITIAVREGGDVVILRRCTQSACRAAGLTGSALVRLTTVVSEAGEHLLGAAGLTAQLRLEAAAGRAALAVCFAWREDRSPSPALLNAAARLLDDSRLLPAGGGRQELVLAQRTTTPATAAGELAARIRVRLAGADTAADLIEALRTQNRHLLAALEESQGQQEELQRLNAELEETNAGVMALYSELTSELQATNTGVVALYAELEDKTRQLELAHEYKTRFWANVSHELRSPVNSVIALARLLESGPDPLSDEQRRQTALVQASGSTLLALVDELLDVAKAESGRLEPHPADVDLAALLHQLAGTLQGTAQPGVGLRIPLSLPAGPLVTDEVMLTRVLRNVLSNALKFTAEGAVTLDVTEEESDVGRHVVFHVRDTGVGIPADDLDRVFEEFYQVRGAHQRGQAGTGLGLPYARKLTELLGGRLTLDSRIGHGTTVLVRIPASPARPAAGPLPGPPPGESFRPQPAQGRRPEEPVLPSAGDGSTDPAPAAVGAVGDTASGAAADVVGSAVSDAVSGAVARSVVVVDDDPAVIHVFRAHLDKVATRVSVVTDSTLAVATVAREQPDAVLLDLTMPVLDGYEVYRLLAADPATARVPVIVLTALEGTDVDHSRLAGVRAVLNKSRLTAPELAAALAALPPHPSLTFPAEDPR